MPPRSLSVQSMSAFIQETCFTLGKAAADKLERMIDRIIDIFHLDASSTSYKHRDARMARFEQEGC